VSQFQQKNPTGPLLWPLAPALYKQLLSRSPTSPPVELTQSAALTTRRSNILQPIPTAAEVAKAIGRLRLG